MRHVYIQMDSRMSKKSRPCTYLLIQMLSCTASPMEKGITKACTFEVIFSIEIYRFKVFTITILLHVKTSYTLLSSRSQLIHEDTRNNFKFYWLKLYHHLISRPVVCMPLPKKVYMFLYFENCVKNKHSIRNKYHVHIYMYVCMYV